MAKQSFVIAKTCKVPSSVVSHHPRNGMRLTAKIFKRGMIVHGELKHADNKPAFVLVDSYVIPVDCVKAVVTKEILSDATGESPAPSQSQADKMIKSIVTETSAKVQYGDAIGIGLLIGVAGLIIIRKYTKILEAIADPKEKKLAMAGIVALPILLGSYLVYRKRNSVKSLPKKKE